MERKTVRTFITILCGIVIAVTAAFLLLNCFGIRNFTMESDSMAPKIRSGALCFVNENKNYDEIGSGDVIVFTTTNVSGEEITLVSRVMAVTDEGLETKGDANEFSDGIAATEEGYIGKNVFSIPLIGRIVDAMRNLAVRIFVYACLVALLVFVFWFGRKSPDSEDAPEAGHVNAGYAGGGRGADEGR